MTSDCTPAVSVVMSVHNGAAVLPETLEALAGQTLANYELVVIDDGSTDSTAAILHARRAADPRIRVISQANTGLTRALNVGLGHARAPLIARQDADDPPRPERLERQAAAFAADPELVLLGSNAEIIFTDGRRTVWGHTADERLPAVLSRQTPFPHSSVMMRTDAVRRAGGYDETFLTGQDTELWMRLGRLGRVSMLPELLIERRMGPASISVTRRYRQFWDGLRARWRHNPDRRAQMLAFSLGSLVLSHLPPRWLLALRARQH